MGQAKLRAEKRREAREESTKPDLRPKLRYLNEPISDRLIEQVKMRYAFLAAHFSSLGEFVESLLEAGMEVCDHDVNAMIAHQRGASTPVDKTQEGPGEERLIATPGEVSKEQMKALAEVSPLGSARGKRTPVR